MPRCCCVFFVCGIFVVVVVVCLLLFLSLDMFSNGHKLFSNFLLADAYVIYLVNYLCLPV